MHPRTKVNGSLPFESVKAHLLHTYYVIYNTHTHTHTHTHTQQAKHTYIYTYILALVNIIYYYYYYFRLYRPT